MDMNHRFKIIQTGGFDMGWKIGGVLSAILAVLAALITLTTAAEYKTGIEWVITLIFVLLAALCFWRAAKAGARKKAKRATAQQVFMTDQELEQIQAGVLPGPSGCPGGPGRRRSRPLLRGGSTLYHEDEGGRPNRIRRRRQCPRGEGRVASDRRRGPVRRSTMMSRIPSSAR